MSTETSPDKKAFRILSKMFWSPQGWNVPAKSVSPEELKYLRDTGHFFEDEELTHDQAIQRAKVAFRAANIVNIFSNFLSSLSTRHVQYRPSLGSYFHLGNLREHEHEGRFSCGICTEWPTTTLNSNSTNFSRIKWGDVPAQGLTGHIFILEQSQRDKVVPYTEADRRIFTELLEVIEKLPSTSKIRDIENAWRPVIKSNKQERESLIEIFIACGILEPESASQSDFDSIAIRSNWSDRAAVWRGVDGFNMQRVNQLFQTNGEQNGESDS